MRSAVAARSPNSVSAPSAAYIHIPFCRRRCFYCDFAISVVGDRPPLARHPLSTHSLDHSSERAVHRSAESYGTIAEYSDFLCQEILATPVLGQPLQTVFFGGGTPSLLTVAQLEQILQTIDRRFGIAADAEISMEIDPGTFDLARLQGYRAAGVNRVSLGVQAFEADLLAACGRTHTPADIDRAIELIHQVNLTNFSLDLISGLPHLTPERWQASLQKAIDLSPAHLSIYDLTIEPGTAFARYFQAGQSPLPSDEQTAQMYCVAQKLLTNAGYDHYEISNYARPGFQCRHNRVYWENCAYYGFGMAAASYTQGQRFTRPRKRRDYYQWVQDYSNRQGTIDCPVASPTEQLLDTLMLGLRLADGLCLQALIDSFGLPIVERVLKTLCPYQQQGWVELRDEQGLLKGSIDLAERIGNSADISNVYIRLSDPEGFLFSNVVLSKLFEQLEPA